MLEQLVGSVQRAARFSASDHQRVPRRAQNESIGAQLIELQHHPHFAGVRIVTQKNFAGRAALSIGNDRQLRPADFLEIALQFLGGIPFCGWGVAGDDDAVLTFALFGEHQSAFEAKSYR